MHSTSELELRMQQLQDEDFGATLSSSSSSSRSSTTSAEARSLRHTKTVLRSTHRVGKHLGKVSSRALRDISSFLQRSAAMDLALAVIISDQVLGIVKSALNDVLMPPVGLLIGSNVRNWFYVIREPTNTTAGPFFTPEDAVAGGAVTINPGRFVQSIIDFLFLVLALYGMFKGFLKIKSMVQKKKGGDDVECPSCFAENDYRATRCRFCTGLITFRLLARAEDDESFHTAVSELDDVAAVEPEPEPPRPRMSLRLWRFRRRRKRRTVEEVVER